MVYDTSWETSIWHDFGIDQYSNCRIKFNISFLLQLVSLKKFDDVEPSDHKLSMELRIAKELETVMMIIILHHDHDGSNSEAPQCGSNDDLQYGYTFFK